jgi:signal transduction histidine kinase
VSALPLKKTLRKAALPSDWRMRYWMRRQESSLAGEAARMEHARGRLEHLYEISKILTRFESIERTVPEVLALMSEVCPLRIAILMLEARTMHRLRTRSIVWHAEGSMGSRARRAQSRAKAAYTNLTRAPPNIEEEAGATWFPTPVPQGIELSNEGFVLLPLVVDHGRIFGALHLEGAARLDEPDLAFANAVVNQLAIVLDRIAIIAAKQAEAKAAQLAAELLAQTSAIFSSSLEYEKTLAAVVHASVPRLADICVLDELTDDRHIRRVEVLFADPGKQAVADRIRGLVPASDSSPQGQVLASGKAIVLESFESFEPDRVDLLEQLGARSMMIVPLIAHGRTLGSLTFVSAESGRQYSAVDLALAEEIGRRAAMAVDNARLYMQAQRATVARQDLLAIVSHDLKNPLATILLCTDMLSGPSFEGQPEPVKRILGIVVRSASRTKRILEDLLDGASIEAGHLSVEKARYEVAPIVREAVDLHAIAAEQKGVRLISSLPGEAFEVDCDRERLLQVLGNLIDNAIKFTPAGGAITVLGEPRDEETLFAVADTGPGIASEELSAVFDRYWQAKKTASIGTGLGLSISKGLVELHGGRIWVESTPGRGATFRFALPVSTTPALAATHASVT